MDIKHYPPTELRAPDLFAPRNRLHLARSLFLCLSTCASSSLMADELSMFIALASKASTQSDLPSQFKSTTVTSPVTQVQSRPMTAATTVVPVQFKPATAASSDTQVQSSSQAATPTVVPVQFKSVAATSQVTQVQSRPPPNVAPRYKGLTLNWRQRTRILTRPRGSVIRKLTWAPRPVRSGSVQGRKTLKAIALVLLST